MFIWIWLGFIIIILLLLALDLGAFNRKTHVISFTESIVTTAFWIILALIFNIIIYYIYQHDIFGIGTHIGTDLTGKQAAIQFFTAYIVEKSLSIDNIFVFALIFSYFQVPLQYQHRVLFWGVLGALVLRGIMIALGSLLIHKFSWTAYIFGAFILVSAARMLIARHDNIKPEDNSLIKLTKKMFHLDEAYTGERFFTKASGKTMITRMFIVLLVVETSDIAFAIDSIPAVFAITRDPFIVFTSNVFAILGLRSLYFALAAILPKFRFLKTSLVFLLAFIGVKMILTNHYHIPAHVSLSFILGILGVGILASILGAHRDTAALISPVADDLEEMLVTTVRQARRIIILVIGSTILLLGTAMLLLPGPGIPFVFLGLIVLGTEFVWAKLWLTKLKKATKLMREKTEALFKD